MDLSSLEGPPILDQPHARDPPSVHLAALPSLGLPPRPASADAVSRIYSLQSQPQSQTPSHGYSRSQSHLIPYPQIPSSHSLSPNANPDSNLPPHYRRARTPSPTPMSLASSSPSPNSSRHTRRAPSPQRLVWLDAEKSWVIVSGSQTSVYRPSSHGCHCGGGNGIGVGMSANMSSTNTNANLNPNTMMPTMNINPVADLYPSPMMDAPPPYESHVFDKPLVQVQGPGGSRRRRTNESAAESASGSGSDGEPSRGRTGGSRWTAVARRLRASPVR
ncbi:hypothetical protein P170DRAFT_477685 [Aspergillus steynii IBT 23096]|uniref:Uncharacterized protein n=1 Tax=Aspergillus steynii IBT 23096 TaxID=1392250 RepID=A0A2I2G1R7_9EURO|nr:uncharacterized protein P170DRAFT_477685 [Aspergillus steynii IBT 23096]PLB46822.1 hypothetical protein P170DRAFT_477685 [Aspergillus steynii IBT 23096]